MEKATLETYQGIRSRRPNYPAAKALAEARERAPDPKRRYYGKRGTAGLGAPMDDGGQWAEYPESLGLRFYGWADELGGRYESAPVDHAGWYMDSEGIGEVARACVYLLPARDGRTRYVPAYREGSTNRAGDWADMSGAESAVLYLRDVELGERGGADQELEQAARDAARYADSRAERMAESAREYSEAWQAGATYESRMEEARSARETFLRLRGEMKAARQPAPTIALALRGQLQRFADEWSEAKREARELADEWDAAASSAASSEWQRRRADLAATFREAAGLPTLSEGTR